jgi:2-desacetyl-2-hydroxyethyl bacteriochlorophyllide A dehydrogenase
MRAAVFRGPHDVAIDDVDAPAVMPDGIVVDVHACGICGSDLHIFATGMGVAPGQVMGHEFAGEVSAVGSAVDGIGVGDRVAAMPLVPCWECRACRAGDVQLCVRAFAPGIAFGLPGAFAEQVHVPGASLGRTVFRLPDGVGFDGGALLEPLAVAVHAVERSRAAPGDTVAVIGLGPIGHLIALVLRARGIDRVVGVERSRRRLELARGAGLAVTGPGTRLRTAVADALGPPADVDVVFECTGVPELAEQASRLARRGGTVTIVAVYAQPAPIDVSAFAVRELTVQGSSAYGPADFREALALVADEVVRPADIVTECRPLAELPAALAAAGEGLKVIIKP